MYILKIYDSQDAVNQSGHVTWLTRVDGLAKLQAPLLKRFAHHFDKEHPNLACTAGTKKLIHAHLRKIISLVFLPYQSSLNIQKKSEFHLFFSTN